MDIFKLIFEHDLRLDKLKERHTRPDPETERSIEEFMKPDPTYSKFYLTGTRLSEEQFGLNTLRHYPEIVQRLEKVFAGNMFRSRHGQHDTLPEALEAIAVGDAVLISEREENRFDPADLQVESDSNVGHFKEELSRVLKSGSLTLYKEHAHHGFDLHLFSEKNIYEKLFYPFKELVSDEFRFFSINGKRIRSERQFYFETWSLDKPPHGAEEVLPETVL
ncbi:MAG: hypothetical protein R3224_00285 [Balneolaceae bacterium]|nr:hypothetical protein [Balneolaceae bacterium]